MPRPLMVEHGLQITQVKGLTAACTGKEVALLVRVLGVERSANEASRFDMWLVLGHARRSARSCGEFRLGTWW